jgi:hypothetical protein
MIDINSIITAALQQAVTEAIKPLEDRLRSLEAWAAHAGPNLTERVYALESDGSAPERILARLDNIEAQQADAITADQVNHLIETALNDLDWEEQTREALNDIDLSSYVDIDEAVREAIADIDWAEQIDLSQLRIVIER